MKKKFLLKRMMAQKHQDLQPWLDYFTMLQEFEHDGLLEVQADKHEAYATEESLLVLAGIDETKMQHDDMLRDGLQMLKAYTDLLRRLRTYAAYLEAQKFQEKEHWAYMRLPFALHVVKDAGKPDLCFTMLMECRRKWWRFWMATDCIEVINYQEKKHG